MRLWASDIPTMSSFFDSRCISSSGLALCQLRGRFLMAVSNILVALSERLEWMCSSEPEVARGFNDLRDRFFTVTENCRRNQFPVVYFLFSGFKSTRYLFRLPSA